MSAIGVFLFFGAVMAFLAGTSLVKPGTSLDRMWVLNPHAYHALAPFGKTVGLLFLALAAALLLAGIGWLKKRLWGWRLAVIIISTQLGGGFANFFFGRVIQAVFGAAIAGALLFYMTRTSVRGAFIAPPTHLRP